MKIEDYRIASQKYSNYNAEAGNERSPQHMVCAALGLVGEAGEVADYLKKVYHHGHPIEESKVKGELGDVLWYIAMAATAVGIEIPKTMLMPDVLGPMATLRPMYAIRLSSCCTVVATTLSAEAHRWFSPSPTTEEDFVESIRCGLENALYQVQALAALSGFTMNDVIEANLAKLAARYPEGSFSQARSINRTL